MGEDRLWKAAWYTFSMEDNEAIKILTRILEKDGLNAEEKEAIRAAIGVLGWTKLVEGWKENKKRLRDKQFDDED